MVEVKISEITIENRTRKVFGWLDSLERSIMQVGVLHPIGITPDKKLLFGERRLRACKNLGMETIPARVFDINADDPVKALYMEREENGHRLDLSPSEKATIAMKIEEVLEGRQGKRTDLEIPQNFGGFEPKAGKELPPNLGEVKHNRESADIAAKAVGMHRETYRKAKAVVNSGSQEVIKAMDSGEKSINAAYNEVKGTPKQMTIKITLLKNPEDDAVTLLSKGGHEYCTKLALALLKAAGHHVEL